MALIHELIPKIMRDVGAIAKNRKNHEQRYMFRGIDDVYQALQEPLAKYGVFFTPRIIRCERDERESKAGGVLTTTLLEVEYVFYAPNGSSVAASVVGEAFDGGDKSCNKAMSAALKYALFQTFCIPTEEPKDSEIDNPELKFVSPKVSSEEYERLRETAVANNWQAGNVRFFLRKQKELGKSDREAFTLAVNRFTKPPTDIEINEVIENAS